MRLLLIHADRFSFKATEKTRIAEDVEEDCLAGSMEEVLVAFAAVEKEDSGNEEQVIDEASKEILSVAKKVGAERVMLYPYAHLSSNLSSPDVAVRVLAGTAENMKGEIEVFRSPFGWYKSFDISCKGHPLSELSRDISGSGSEQAKSHALAAEEKLVSSWYILDASGTLHPAQEYDFREQEELERFFQYEYSKVRKDSSPPPHIKMMQSQEMVDYEPGSDPGHFRYYPKGRFVKSLLEEYVTSKVLEYGGMEVETPIMYDMEHPSLKSYLSRFPARQYAIETPQKRVFLRFAACFGQFLMAHDATISYRSLPLRLYEMTKYSFRVEQRGELSGLRRLRAFTMPDCHAICEDVEQAKEEMMTRFKLAVDIQKGIGFDVPGEMDLAIRTTNEFWEANKEYITSLVKEWKKPALVEIWDQQFFYFVMKYEFNFTDSSGKAAALTTDQIDVENAKTYGIKYVGEDGEEKTPVILHLSPSGAIERVIYALLEREAKNKKPSLPAWLSPTHVRFIPVNSEFNKECIDLAKSMGKNIRADVDDRDGTIGKKIREAEKEWIEHIAVYGEKEKESGMLSVRMRSTGSQENMTLEALSEKICRDMEGYPLRPLPLPMLLSKRPGFR